MNTGGLRKGFKDRERLFGGLFCRLLGNAADHNGRTGGRRGRIHGGTCGLGLRTADLTGASTVRACGVIDV
jgi:hypothetical protein